MPISIETQKASLIAVKMPEGTSKFQIADVNHEDKNIWIYYENNLGGGSIELKYDSDFDFQDYEILGLVSDITEDVAKSIVEECFKNRFVDYRMISQTIDSFKYTAVESLTTLLQSHGLNPKENYLLIKKVK